MTRNLDKSLFNLKGGAVSVSATNYYPEPGMASVQLLFPDGSTLRAEYWRVMKNGKACMSSFDHRQQYGLPAPIDAISELEEQLRDKTVVDALLDAETGDLLFHFTDNIKFQVFNLSSYEVWEIHFADGTGEYSPSARPALLI
jgi:hypothetical protein